jgi:hypothetical protein
MTFAATLTSPSKAPSSVDPYIASHSAFVQIHHALEGSLHTVISAAPAVAVSQALAAGQFLLGHHAAESSVLFPGLRRHGRLRSSDVAFLDACDRQHEELHALCARLLEDAGAPHPHVGEVRTVARATLALFSAHIVEEEAGLMPERLRTMISVAGLEEIGRELEGLHQRRA